MNYHTLASSIPKNVINSVGQLDFDLAKWEQNPRIGKLLSETVLTGGKRIRPLITFLMADFFGISHEEIAPYGKTVELVHASTLAHDDVIDNATHRRNNPSINIVATNKKAILAGDYLLAYSVNLISTLGRNDIVIELTKMIRDLAEGEWVQMENAENAKLFREDVLKVSECKTATVMKWCCIVPALLRNLDRDQLVLVEELGEAIGIAFQMTDDILDFKRKDPSKLADVKNKVVNSVIFEALLASGGNKDWVDMTSISEINIEVLDIESAIIKVRAQVEKYLEIARNNLERLSEVLDFDDDTHKKALSGMIALINYLAVRI